MKTKRITNPFVSAGNRWSLNAVEDGADYELRKKVTQDRTQRTRRERGQDGRYFLAIGGADGLLETREFVLENNVD